MNATEEILKAQGWDHHINFNQMMLTKIFGSSETLFSFDTYQFEGYSRVVSRVDPEKKAKVRREVFPKDCEKAFKMGVRFSTSLFTASNLRTI